MDLSMRSERIPAYLKNFTRLDGSLVHRICIPVAGALPRRSQDFDVGANAVMLRNVGITQFDSINAFGADVLTQFAIGAK
jgi:hypothetical protein